MRIISLQIGEPKDYRYPEGHQSAGATWTSAIAKRPLSGRVWVGHEGLAGDRQANRKSHGGPDRALLGYAAEHYPSWRDELGRGELHFGSFGENLTIEGQSEHTVCLGDVVEAGTVKLEVSSPRVPCQKLARYLVVPDMVDRVLQRGAFGWYYRVQHEGWLEAGAPVTVVDRPYPHWTMLEAMRVWLDRSKLPEDAARLAACPALIAQWRDRLEGARSDLE